MERRLPLLSGALCLVQLIAASASAETLRVPLTFPTIESAIDASSVGDTVLVAPGTYFETVDIHHQLTLLSEEGPEYTTIDAQDQGTVVSTWLPAQGAVIEGFRITGGNAGVTGRAGGIHVQVNFSSGWAVIRNNVIEGNESPLGPGGVSAFRSSVIEDNIIQNNNPLGSKAEGALAGSGTIRRNIIRSNMNWNHHTVRIQGASILFQDNVIVNNGLSVMSTLAIHATGVCRNNTIANNLSAPFGAVELSGSAPLEFANNVVSHGNSPGLACDFNGAQVSIRCNNVWGAGNSYNGDCIDRGGVDGNFSLDPLFCDAGLGDYRLSSESPCLPENSPPGCGLIGALPACSVLGVQQEGSPAGARLLILRNPVSSAAEFIVPDAINFPTIEIYDSAGRLVDTIDAKTPRVIWAPRPQSRGVYFARVQNGRDVGSAKFVVLH